MQTYLNDFVVVPWDFSDMAMQALQSALGMVDSPDKISVIHVTPYPPTTAPEVIWGAIDEQTIRDRVAKSFGETLDEANIPKLKFTTEFGNPGKKIADHAKAENASLVIISSHGRSGVNRLLMGSVAERVVRLAPCPVLVLRGEQES